MKCLHHWPWSTRGELISIAFYCTIGGWTRPLVINHYNQADAHQRVTWGRQNPRLMDCRKSREKTLRKSLNDDCYLGDTVLCGCFILVQHTNNNSCLFFQARTFGQTVLPRSQFRSPRLLTLNFWIQAGGGSSLSCGSKTKRQSWPTFFRNILFLRFIQPLKCGI